MSTSVPSALFDLLLVGTLLWCAWIVLTTPQTHRAVVTFIVFGLLMALAWARMQAPDISMAEAAIGAGLTGALLLDAYGSLRRHRTGKEAGWKRFRTGAVVIVAASIFTFTLAGMRDLAPSLGDLRPAVALNLPASGVEHPVTAVLLNYRSYDTLLEVAVLLIAVLGVLAAGPKTKIEPARPSGQLPQAVAQAAVPVMIVVAIYLLWAGAIRPGGAFQAGAVLAASAVLLHLTGLLPAWQTPGYVLRVGLAFGFLTFLMVAATMIAGGALLRYPPVHAGTLILMVESALAVSIGLTLAGLFLFLSVDGVNGP